MDIGTKQITINGTAGNDVLSVAIFVYDSTGTTLIKMESVAVDNSHKYTDTIEIENGTYLVKVADYEGGEFKTTTVTVGGSTVTNGPGQAEKPATSPKTGETNTAFGLGMLAFAAACGVYFLRKQEISK